MIQRKCSGCGKVTSLPENRMVDLRCTTKNCVSRTVSFSQDVRMTPRSGDEPVIIKADDVVNIGHGVERRTDYLWVLSKVPIMARRDKKAEELGD